MKNEPVLGYWDVETAFMLLASFARYGEMNIPYSSVFQDWFMFCAAFQLEGKKAKLVSVLDNKKRFNKDFTDDYHVIKTLRDFIDSVDILVAHNGDHFDWKKFKARLIYHKIPVPRKPILIDTYKEAKTSQFTSNKLGDLAIQLELPHKSRSNSGDWLICTLPYGYYPKLKLRVTKETKAAALKRIGKYNLKDLPPLISLYKRLRPYMNRHPNLNQWAKDGKPRCTNCGSTALRSDGSSRGFPQFICTGCGKKSQGMKRKYTMKLR